MATSQQLASFVVPTERVSNSTADIIWSSLHNRGGHLTTYQDQLASSLLRQVVGETKEEFSTSELPSLQGVPSIDALLTMLRQSQEGEAHLLAALQRHVEAHSADSSRNALLESHQRQLQGRGDELTGRSSTPQQQLQSGSHVDALASLLQQRHASLELGGTSVLPQPMDTNHITPEVIAALQQLQGGDRTTSDLAGLFQRQSQGQAWDTLLPSRQSIQPIEGLLATLQLQYGGSPSIEGVLARLQQPLGGGSATGRQSSVASNIQQENPNENLFAAMPGSDGNAANLVSSLLRLGRESATPGAPSTNSVVQQILANQGLFAGGAHSSVTALSATDMALAQSMLAANSVNNLSPAFAASTAGTSDTSRLGIANLDRTALAQELINRSLSMPSTTALEPFQGLSGLLATHAGSALQSESQLAHQQRQPGGQPNSAIHSYMLQQHASRLLEHQHQTQQQQTNPWLQLGTGVASGPSSQAGAQDLQAAYRFLGPQASSANRGDEKDEKDASDEKDSHKPWCIE
jgi:hypothetical protein